jgi:hypothetical protein
MIKFTDLLLPFGSNNSTGGKFLMKIFIVDKHANVAYIRMKHG